MSLFVVDQSPELFWYVSNSLISLELPLKHIPDLTTSESHIFNELPKIVIINADSTPNDLEKYIAKMRNHIFARNILFIIFTSDSSMNFRRKLVIAGASQVFYRNKTQFPDSKLFLQTIKWILNYKVNEFEMDQEKKFPFQSVGELTTWGRIGTLSSNLISFESNLDLSVGQKIKTEAEIFTELNFKNCELEILKKDHFGRYYQYAHSYAAKIHSKNSEDDLKTLKSWLENNGSISKSKFVKIVYFEPSPEYRNTITQMIKLDKSFGARGYADLENFEEALNFQLPQLILINRKLIQQSKNKFDYIKRFLKNNLCYLITYEIVSELNLKDFQTQYPFAMHSQTPLEISLLESMIEKLEKKLPDLETPDNPIIVFGKHSPYSRISFHLDIQIEEIGANSLYLRSKLKLSPYCAVEINSPVFQTHRLTRPQIYRCSKLSKASENNMGQLHKFIHIGKSQKEADLIETALNEIEAEIEKNSKEKKS